VVVAAQQFPYEPAKQFGTNVTPSFEGWYDNPDGSHVFLIGYMNRNRQTPVDVPIGPNNRIEPGGPDMGQPTHFLPGRQTGMFTITVPKEFSLQQRMTWTLTVNGQTATIPFKLIPEYTVRPFKDAAIGNTPPIIKLFDEKAPGAQGPIASAAKAATRTATVSQPLQLPVWANDDAKYTSGTNAPMARPRPVVTMLWSKFRGPGDVKFDPERPKVDVISGGQQDQPFSGKATATATFSAPGEYYLHLTANDYSGAGGGGEICCWTTALVKVNVSQ
jgi:hypothetical protein